MDALRAKNSQMKQKLESSSTMSLLSEEPQDTTLRTQEVDNSRYIHTKTLLSTSSLGTSFRWNLFIEAIMEVVLREN